MTTSPPDRLDRIERILDTLAANQVEERDRRLELRDETRQDAEVLFQTIRQTNETVDRLGDRLDQLTASQEQAQQQLNRTQQQLDTLSSDVGELRFTVDTAFQQAEQDRSQAAIDRAEFRSTVTQLLEVLTQRFNGNGTT